MSQALFAATIGGWSGKTWRRLPTQFSFEYIDYEMN